MVTVYSQPNCMPCRFTKKRLQDQGTPFKEVDVQQDPDALEMIRGLGYMQAPVVVAADGSHWSGFNPGLIDALAA